MCTTRSILDSALYNTVNLFSKAQTRSSMSMFLISVDSVAVSSFRAVAIFVLRVFLFVVLCSFKCYPLPVLDCLFLYYRLWSRNPVSYTHLRAHETRHDLVCRLLLEKKK